MTWATYWNGQWKHFLVTLLLNLVVFGIVFIAYVVVPAVRRYRASRQRKL